MCAPRCHESTHILLVYLHFQFNCLQMLKYSYFHTRLFVTTVAIKIAEELSKLTSLKKCMLLCTKSISSCDPDCIWHRGLRYVVSASEIRNIYVHIKSLLYYLCHWIGGFSYRGWCTQAPHVWCSHFFLLFSFHFRGENTYLVKGNI